MDEGNRTLASHTLKNGDFNRDRQEIRPIWLTLFQVSTKFFTRLRFHRQEQVAAAKEMRIHARLGPVVLLSKPRHVRLNRFVPPILFAICARPTLTPATEHRSALTVIGYLLGAKT